MPQYVKIIENVLSPALCQELMDRFDRDPKVRPDPQPHYSKRRYLNLSTSRDWMRSVQTVTRLADPVIADFFRFPAAYESEQRREWMNDGWILARYAPGDVCGFHDDAQSAVPPGNGLRLATMIFFLNSVPEGGELHFPMQNLKVPAVQGRVVMFPAQLTHPHEVLVTASDRYVLQTWVVDPEMVVLARDALE